MIQPGNAPKLLQDGRRTPRLAHSRMFLLQQTLQRCVQWRITECWQESFWWQHCCFWMTETKLIIVLVWQQRCVHLRALASSVTSKKEREWQQPPTPAAGTAVLAHVELWGRPLCIWISWVWVLYWPCGTHIVLGASRASKGGMSVISTTNLMPLYMVTVAASVRMQLGTFLSHGFMSWHNTFRSPM